MSTELVPLRDLAEGVRRLAEFSPQSPVTQVLYDVIAEEIDRWAILSPYFDLDGGGSVGCDAKGESSDTDPSSPVGAGGGSSHHGARSTLSLAALGSLPKPRRSNGRN
jgi:hypothetical protein